MVAEPDGKGGYLVKVEQGLTVQKTYGKVTMEGSAGGSGQSSDEPKSSLWGLLPSFDPSEDDAKEYADKVKFLWGVCPQRDRGMLAPRLSPLQGNSMVSGEGYRPTAPHGSTDRLSGPSSSSFLMAGDLGDGGLREVRESLVPYGAKE